MKTLYFSIIAILLATILFPFNGISGQVQPQTTMQLSIPTLWFADGEIIPITGKFLPYSTIHISLTDNLGNLENSTEVSANSTGNFQTNLVIPLHVIGGGSWHISAVSDETFKALQIIVNTHGVSTLSDNFPSNLSPLKQFKLGMTANMVQCHSDFQLVLKKENGEFACVTKETADKLFDRGWAEFSLKGLPTTQTPQNSTLPASFMPCDTPFPQTNSGIPVLFIPMNSIGKICVRYSNLNDFSAPVGIRISSADNLMQNASDISTWNDLGGNTTISKGNSTVVYWIHTGNHAGFYGLTIFCVPVGLAVGYDNDSRIVSDNFPWIGKTFECPMQSYDFHIDSLTGIGVKYIPYP